MFRNATARMLVLFGLLISAGLVFAADRNNGVEARETRYSVTGFALNVLAITDHEEDNCTSTRSRKTKAQFWTESWT